MSKKGVWLEKEVEKIAGQYQRDGFLHLEKVDPPVRIVGGKTMFMRNPFVDFTGAWTERAGRSLHLEAKSTEKPKLEFGSGGITDRQVEALIRWRRAGAATGILWGMEPSLEIRWVPVEAIEAQIRQNIRHIKWENATPIPRGPGFVSWNWLRLLRAYHPRAAICA